MLSFASFVISLVAIGLSLYDFVHFGRKIKKQTIELNEIKLCHEHETMTLSKSAHIEVVLKKTDVGIYALQIKNTGLGIARNVWIVCESEVLSGGLFRGPCFESGQVAEQPISFGMLTQNWIDVRREWDDDNGHHKEVRPIYFTEI